MLNILKLHEWLVFTAPLPFLGDSGGLDSPSVIPAVLLEGRLPSSLAFPSGSSHLFSVLEIPLRKKVIFFFFHLVMKFKTQFELML